MVQQRNGLDQTRILTWIGVLLGILTIVVAVLLPGTQSWLCQSVGLRLACNSSPAALKIDIRGFHRQTIPRSTDGTLIRDALISQAPPDVSALPKDTLPPDASTRQPATPIRCDESPDFNRELALWEKNVRNQANGNEFVRGDENYVLADIALSFLPSEADLEILVDITIRAPKAGDNIESQLWPDFGSGHFAPGKQRMKVIAPANSDSCQLSFLLIPLWGMWGPSTDNWHSGKYFVDVDARDGGQRSHAHGEFKIAARTGPDKHPPPN